MQYGKGKPLFLLISLVFGCVFMHGLFTKINIEFVTTSNVHERHFPEVVTVVIPLVEKSHYHEVVTVVVPLEEIKKRKRERAVDPLLKENVAADDKRLAQVIRDHFIDPPSKKQPKNSNPLVRTPQAAVVEDILHRKVSS